MRKTGIIVDEHEYNKLKIVYYTYPVGNFYHAHADIPVLVKTMHFNKRIELSSNYLFRYEAENEIIKAAQAWVDNFLECYDL